MTVRALLLHSDPAQVLELLEAGCPDARWRAVARAEDVAAALAEHRPEVVFSIKHNDLPGPAHRPALVAPSVRWFHVGGSGRDHLGAWDPGRVTVTTSAGVLAPFLAERALAGLLAMSTGLVEQLAAQRERRWAPTSFRALAGRTLVVVGLGHTGAALAARARGLGLHVVGVRASGEPHGSAHEVHRPEALHSLLPRADVLSLHVPLGERTRHLIGARELALLPRGALLLNAARGAVVDTEALVDALAPGPARRVLGAWLDVFEEEPLPPEHPLWTLPGVVVSAHCADQVEGWPRRFAERFVENWRRRANGEPLLGVVRPD